MGHHLRCAALANMTPIGFFCLAIAGFGIASARSPQWSGRTDQRIGSDISNRALRIVGGDEAEPHSVPWQVGLFTEKKFGEDKQRKFICGGSIISKTYVLTAAHCVHDKESRRPLSSREILVMAGAHASPLDFNPKPKESTRSIHPVKRIVAHPGFDGQYGQPDFAILKLKKPIEVSKAVRPVALASKGLYKDFDKFEASGWGHLGKPSGFPIKLQKVSIPWKKCTDDRTKWIICAGDADSNVCVGDSGGPLTWTDPKTDKVKLVGVSSFGNEDKMTGQQCRGPAGFAKVSAVLKWIKKNTK